MNPDKKIILTLSSIGALGFFAAHPFSAAAQEVIIEGGPNAVQISDRDGAPEPVVPGPAVPEAIDTEVQIPQSTTFESSTISAEPRIATEIRPIPNSDVTVRVPAEADPNEGVGDVETGITAAAEVEPLTETIDVERVKRMEELERELKIVDAATTKQINITTENLYDENGVLLDVYAEPILLQVAEYVDLANPVSVDVSYRFVPDKTPKDVAWERSMVMVKWISEQGEIDRATFEISEPQIVTEQTPVEDAPDPLTMQFQERLSLTLRQGERQ